MKKVSMELVKLFKFFFLFSTVASISTEESSSSSESTEPCQPDTVYDTYPPKIPHMVLNDSFLSQFEEILVIGDIHGCYDEQQLLLKRAKADNSKVLKIFVGDLVIGGPKNIEVIRFVRNCPSCISVRGNNDQNTIVREANHRLYGKRLRNIDKWMVNMSQTDVDFMKSLPYTISLPSLNAVVVHAGLLPGLPLEKNNAFTMMIMRDIVDAPECPGGFRPTNAEFVTAPWASKWPGPQHVYFGHDHGRQLQLYKFATGVDTSCCRGHYMTGIFINGPRKNTFVTQSALKVYYPGGV